MAEIIRREVVDRRWSEEIGEFIEIERGVIVCRCGRELLLYDAFTSTCDHCEADYNGSGQELAPRSQWGEETGETAADILNGGDPFDE